MQVGGINSAREANSVTELEALLMVRIGNSFNSFWLSHDNEEFPTMSILVKDELAALHYMPQEFEAGYRSVGKMAGLEPGGSTSFSISGNPGDDVELTNEAVLSFSTALSAAKEFFYSSSLPKSIEWFEL